MAFREVDVIEVRGILRAWLAGKGQRSTARQAGVDRKTVVVMRTRRSPWVWTAMVARNS